MASIAHAQRLSHYDLRERAERAETSFRHISFTVEQLGRIARRVGSTLHRWAAAHQQRVQDRLFWELALTDPRVMSELRAIQDHAEQPGAGRAS